LRTPLVVGNWKMNGRVGEAIELAAGVKSGVGEIEGVEVVVCPPFTALKPVGDLLRYGRVRLGAQNVHPEPAGAFTGEISVAMLADLACDYVLVGHSERRSLFHEDDALVSRKARAVLEGGMRPIVCVGETLAEREAGRTEDVLARQVTESLGPLGPQAADVVLAYEPVWAIGTGRMATAEQVQSAHAFLRSRLRPLVGDDRADALRILYGGSVKPEKVAEVVAQSDVDGGLVGGASLVVDTFVDIVRIVAGD
jgi:triosephosphate isomerase (TIM)